MSLPLPEYDRLDALALGGLIARRELSPGEVLEAALARADARNPPLGALVARFDDEARRRAAGPLPEGPLSGVPFLLKDLMTAWKGHPMSFGSRLGEGFVPDRDSEVVRRLEAAGLVLFGLTSAPEFGIHAHTEPALWGPARNPWNVAHTPGGSSGGSAAAVAARIVPAAHGNDGGGSIRIPASDCGLFGLKGTRGRVSMAPYLGEGWLGLAVEGVLTRSVRDSAALLDLLAGHVPGDPYAAPAPARPFAAEVATPPGRLRVAFTEENFFGHGVSDDAVAAVRGAARLMEELGHEVEEARPPFEREPMVLAYLQVVAAGVAALADTVSRFTGRRPGPSTLEAETLGLLSAGRTTSAAELVASLEAMRRMARELAPFFERFDVLVTPTVAQPPVKVGALKARAWERAAIHFVVRAAGRALRDQLFERIADRSFDATGFTMPWNQTGQPAMSLPLHWTADGLPMGVQVVGRFGDEATLLRLAAQLEEARPWAERVPPGVRSSVAVT